MRDERTPAWDLPVRSAHWLLVLGVCGSWLTHYLGPAWFAWHRRFGYAVLVIVVFRIVWGFAGTRHARFSEFVRGPRGIARWLRAGAPVVPGHNPLGALSVLAMLLLLLVQALTGLFANDEVSSSGPFYGWVLHETSNRLSGVHRANENWLLALIIVHLAAVAWYELVRGRRLIRAMWTGRGASEDAIAGGSAEGSRIGRAVLIALALGVLLALLVRLAPQGTVLLF
jgi:cytochrome b